MLVDQIKVDIIKAQKEQNAKLLGVLRLLVSELNYKAIDLPADAARQALQAGSGSLTDDLAISVLQKEARKRQESIDIYIKAADAARAEAERYELEVINSYLPKDGQ